MKTFKVIKFTALDSDDEKAKLEVSSSSSRLLSKRKAGVLENYQKSCRFVLFIAWKWDKSLFDSVKPVWERLHLYNS